MEELQEIRLQYKDDLHDIVVLALSRASAWMMIRVQCHEKGLKVPTINQVKRYAKLSFTPVENDN